MSCAEERVLKDTIRRLKHGMLLADALLGACGSPHAEKEIVWAQGTVWEMARAMLPSPHKILSDLDDEPRRDVLFFVRSLLKQVRAAEREIAKRGKS